MTTDRRSPPTQRVVKVLNLLTDAPRARFTLTEIATQLELNKPTCLGILTALAEADFVTRDDAKTYGLGPALLRVGAAAELGVANLDVVRPYLFQLHRELGMSCLLSTLVDNEIVVLDRVGLDMGGTRRELVGARFPFKPPLGLVNVVWDSDAAIDRWLAQPWLAQVPTDLTGLYDVIAAARRDGCLVEKLADASTAPNILLANLFASNLPSHVVDAITAHLPEVDWSEYVRDPRSATGNLSLAHISVPIRDRTMQQRYALTAVVERAVVTPAECAAWVDIAVRTSRAATAALGGGIR